MMVGYQVELAEPVTVTGAGVSIVIPGAYREASELQEMLTKGGSMHAIAYAGDGDELVVTWAAAPRELEGSLPDLLASMKDPAIAYRVWNVSGDRVDMEYASPRGKVIAAIVAAGSDARRVVTAMCSHQGGGQRCRDTIATLRVQAP